MIISAEIFDAVRAHWEQSRVPALQTAGERQGTQISDIRLPNDTQMLHRGGEIVLQLLRSHSQQQPPLQSQGVPAEVLWSGQPGLEAQDRLQDRRREQAAERVAVAHKDAIRDKELRQ